LGQGQPLFSGLRKPVDLRPISATPFASGAVGAVRTIKTLKTPLCSIVFQQNRPSPAGEEGLLSGSATYPQEISSGAESERAGLTGAPKQKVCGAGYRTAPSCLVKTRARL
jgi:hypothetical protein